MWQDTTKIAALGDGRIWDAITITITIKTSTGIGVAWKNDKGECGDPFGAN